MVMTLTIIFLYINYNVFIMGKNKKKKSNVEISSMESPLEDLYSEDLYIEKSYSFRVNNNQITLFKNSEESYLYILLKVLGYAIYKPFYNYVEIDPPPFRDKYKADLLVYNNYGDEPIIWGNSLNIDIDKIEYICRHTNIKEITIFKIGEDIEECKNKLKNKIHYKYHDRIVIINFIPEIPQYIDPYDIIVLEDWYERFELH